MAAYKNEGLKFYFLYWYLFIITGSTQLNALGLLIYWEAAIAKIYR